MHPVPDVFAGASNTIAVLVLLTEFAMLRSALLRAQLRLYAAQSLLLSVLALIAAASRGLPDLYVLAALSFGLKVVLVPFVVGRLLRHTSAEIAGSGALGVASEAMLALIVAAFGFFATGALHISSNVLPTTALAISVAVVLVAFVLIIARRDLVSQAVGFFSLENGVSLASLVVAAGLPLILEVAFLFDLLVAVVIFGVLARATHSRSGSFLTTTLNSLRG
jgi:hydrogenase-4 component E